VRPFGSSTGHYRAHRAAVSTVLTLLILGVSAAACSSQTAGTTTTSSATTSSAATTSPTTASSTSPPASTTTFPSQAASEAQIEKVYKTLFDLASPAIAPKLSSVQDGTTLKAAFTAAIASSLAKEAGGAKVLSVHIEGKSACGTEDLPAPCALVTYDILTPKGAPLLKNSRGFAVYSDGHWLVAKTTICTLLTLDNGGQTPSGC
jgi:hypothetical protein